MVKVVVPVLKGGLGNQLFIIASAFAIAKKMGMPMRLSYAHIETRNVCKHSRLDYFSSIFQYIEKHDSTDDDVLFLNDYFQDYTHFDVFYNDIQCLFWLPPVSSIYESDLSNTCFIHYRKTDFLDPGVSETHHVLNDDTQYYENCIQHARLLFPRIEFLVFSDDIDATLDHHSYLHAFPIARKGLNELETLAIMRECGMGGIAANSTFSWWGLYLNRDRPLMMMPNTFFNHSDMNHSGYHFPGCIVKYI